MKDASDVNSVNRPSVNSPLAGELPRSNYDVSRDLAALDVTSLRNRRASSRWNRISVGDVHERVAWSRPTAEALVGWPGAFESLDRLSYSQVSMVTNQVANTLLSLGLNPGDVVAMYCENSVEGVLVRQGIAKAGMTCAPMNPMMAHDQLVSMIELVEPKFLVVDAELWPRGAAAFEQCGVAPGVTICIGGTPVASSVSFADFVADSSAAEPDVEIHGDDIVQILFTSGTTSAPKGVMLSHANGYMSGYGILALQTAGHQFHTDTRIAAFLPILYHASEVLIASTALAGGTLVVGRRPDVAEMARAVHVERITSMFAGMPRMVEGLAIALEDDPSLDASSLLNIIYGWAAMDPRLHDRITAVVGDHVQLCAILAQTEVTIGHVFWHGPNLDLFREVAPKQNYIGFPNPIIASRLADDNGAVERYEGAVGEGTTRSPGLMAGYYRNPEASREAFRNGWFHGGDLFQFGQDGMRKMVDRSKDLIKSGGENVASIRVEALLDSHPAVSRSIVVGLPHPRWDEAVTALVLPAEGHEAGDQLEAELIAFSKASLAPYEVPKRVVFIDSFPETVGGKVLKHQLRERFAALYI